LKDVPHTDTGSGIKPKILAHHLQLTHQLQSTVHPLIGELLRGGHDASAAPSVLDKILSLSPMGRLPFGIEF
jgi:hypothetical protein